MKVEVIAKLNDITKKAAHLGLQHVFVKNGIIYASDSYIAFRIFSKEFNSEDEGFLDIEKILKFKNSEHIALHDFELLPFNGIAVPEMDKIFDNEKDSSNISLDSINPELMIKVMNVFKALKYSKHDLVYPTIKFVNPQLRFTYINDLYRVEAIVMLAKGK